MGKIKQFDILFSNPNNAYYSGQPVTGKVVVEIAESMKIRAVKLKFVGEASVNFNDGKLKKNHTDSQKYFEQLDLIFGSDANSIISDASTVLNAGHHEFPFVFNLPAQLPSSFESNLGHVRYFCKAYLHRPWKFDFTAKKAFTVVSVVDLNRQPSAFTPGYKHVERTFSLVDRLLRCIKGGLSISLKIDRCAYVPGEEILVNAEITNNCSIRVKSVEAYLQQNLVFTAKSATRFCRGETKLALMSHGEVKRGGVQVWNNEPLAIPAVPPTNLGGCRLISADYLLNFVVFVENAANIVLTIPIVIGTIPLRSTLPPVETVAVAPTISSAVSDVSMEVGGVRRSLAMPSAPVYEPHVPSSPSAPPLSEFTMPPPTYEECCVDGMGGQVNIQDSDDNQFTYGQLTYRPLYPTYTMRRAAGIAA